MVDAEVGTVGTQVLDRLGELDRLDERVRARLRTCEYGDADQCPNDRKPIFFIDRF